ncbi:hypothetical protein [Caldisericum exile]|uniref:hypothetical protein n=1 Tax=Caldisericum exile TaxID=693075 RepID=UPI003C77633B
MVKIKSEVKENVEINKGKFYIIILNYHGWADTIECLESLLRNSKGEDYTLWI